MTSLRWLPGWSKKCEKTWPKQHQRLNGADRNRLQILEHSADEWEIERVQTVIRLMWASVIIIDYFSLDRLKFARINLVIITCNVVLMSQCFNIKMQMKWSECFCYVTGDGNIRPTTVVVIVSIAVGLLVAAVIGLFILWKKRKQNTTSKLSLRNTVIPVHCIYVVSQKLL